MQTKKREEVRDEKGQLLTLLNGWDPAGLLAGGGARDAYSRIVDNLLPLLSRRASKSEVATFLEHEIREQFDSAPRDAAQFAAKAITWYRLLPDGD